MPFSNIHQHCSLLSKTPLTCIGTLANSQQHVALFAAYVRALNRTTLHSLTYICENDLKLRF